MKTTVLLIGLCVAAAGQRPDPARVYTYEREELTVPDFEAKGYVLDIGGGGEGVIGKMKPAQVVAIDLIKRELEESPAGPLKIVMDARDLKFLDNSFATATAFFTLMYIKEPDQEKVFREVWRVLQPKGRFLIWDVTLPTRPDPAKDIAVFRFLFKLPYGEVQTGYGTFFPERAHDLEYFTKLAAATGFEVAGKGQSGRTLRLELRKP
jgi:ubiquinone/menaquinone biosynthesis C-methylase UbiE